MAAGNGDGLEPVPYSAFRGSVTFEQARAELAMEQARAKDNGDRMYVTRRTVLGRLHQYKKAEYERYIRGLQ